MRVRVDGINDTAKALAGMLRMADIVVSDTFHSYRIAVEESLSVQHIEVDGIDCDLERQIVKHVAALAPSGKVVLQRGEGVQDDHAVKITVPMDDKCRYAVELGVSRALSQTKGAPKPKWWKRRVL